MAGAEIRFLEYEKGNPRHAERFAALNREWLTRYFFVEPEDEAIFRDPEGRVLAAGGAILFVETRGEIVGTGSVLKLGDGSFEIAKMAVTGPHQGQGLGERFMRVLIDRTRALGAKRLFIVSNTELEPAIRLYRRHGFRDSAENRHSHYARGNITLELSLPHD